MSYFPLLLGLFLGLSAQAAEVYVKSLKAPILKEAKNGSEIVIQLDRGSKLSADGTQGSFVKVSASGKTGFMNKLFLTERPPEGQGSLLNKDVDISTNARKRASGFSSAAAARGLKEDSDEIFKTLGAEVNPQELKKMESFKVKARQGLEFILDDQKRLSL